MGRRDPDWGRWWLVALLPKRVASWLWCEERIPLGSWGPYVLGQSLGVRGRRVEGAVEFEGVSEKGYDSHFPSPEDEP